MKAEFSKEGSLIIIAENYTESYALESWHKENINGCTLQFKEENPRCFFIITKRPKITLFERIKKRIQLWFLNRRFIIHDNGKIRNRQT
jgi:hypothetical protein